MIKIAKFITKHQPNLSYAPKIAYKAASLHPYPCGIRTFRGFARLATTHMFILPEDCIIYFKYERLG